MTCIAIGKFDALHRGHHALVVAGARTGSAVALLTFSGMADILRWPQRPPLVAPSDKQRITTSWGQALHTPVSWLELPFADIQPLEPAAFVDVLRHRLHAHAVVVGADYRFGKNRSGDCQDLERLGRTAGLTVVIVPPVTHDGAIISSSRIRECLDGGDIKTATELLGRPHRIVGSVIRGDGRGRRLGFPTANCGELENMAPCPGVYACWATIGSTRLQAAVNIGHLPTIGPARSTTVEAHLLGYTGDCYGQRITLDVIVRLRDEQSFASLQDLTAQIARDVAEVPRRLGA